MPKWICSRCLEICHGWSPKHRNCCPYCGAWGNWRNGMEKMNRPDVLVGKTIRLRTSCGWIYITHNTHEVFINLGKAGGCAATQTEAIGRLISLALQYHIPIEE